MISNKLEDYEVLSILGGTLQSTCYKVKCKQTLSTYVWRAASLEKLDGQIDFVEKLDKKCLVEHPNLVKFYKPIHHEETNTLYIITDYYEHSLHNIVNKCKKNECIDESFIWYLIFCVTKSLKVLQLPEILIQLSKIFVSKENIVKLLSNVKKQMSGERKTNVIYDLGVVLHQLCTLKTTFDCGTVIPSNYTEQIRCLIDLFMRNKDEDTVIFDSVLRHPTVLISTDYKKDSVYVEKTLAKSSSKTTLENITNHDVESSRLENIHNKMVSLKNLEEKLKQKEHELKQREKKVALTERMVKEKMVRAELYLKRSREGKATSKTSLRDKKTKNLDTSFSADCGDTSILPTSKKMNANEIIKPPLFTRTYSERRSVKFKGHSPLRTIQYTNTIHFNRYNKQNANSKEIIEYQLEGRVPKSDKENYAETNSTNSQPNNEKRTFSIFRSIRQKKSKKPLFRNSVTSVEDTCSAEEKSEVPCQPIAWPEDAKKQAFDLLRIMNSADDIRQNPTEVKHTYL